MYSFHLLYLYILKTYYLMTNCFHLNECKHNMFPKTVSGNSKQPFKCGRVYLRINGWGFDCTLSVQHSLPAIKRAL